MVQKIIVIFFLINLYSCSSSIDKKQDNDTKIQHNLLHAKRFSIKENSDFKTIELFGNKKNYEATATFILYKNEKPNYPNNNNTFYIKVPVKRVASMSSIYTTMIDELQELESVVAIDNINYYNNSKVITSVQNNKVTELSKGPTIEIEKTIALNPDLLLTFGMGNPSSDIDKKLLQANIPIAVALDHLEETPLARAEWIKFIACFFGKETMADSLFSITEKKYNYFKQLTSSISKKPTVLTEIKYGDAWYIPSGKSYIANLLLDAGASYFWADEPQTGSIPLSFETVYTTAKDCDYWINLYNVNSKKELISYDERYRLFKAFKDGHLYNNNKTQNTKGYSNYWETGITHPDAILEDLISIFCPTLLPNHRLSYYKKIE